MTAQEVILGIGRRRRRAASGSSIGASLCTGTSQPPQFAFVTSAESGFRCGARKRRFRRWGFLFLSLRRNPPRPTNGPGARAVARVPARAVARTLKGTVIWLLTTLPAKQASGRELMQLYRLRWQIELFFKRLKSWLPFDALPSRQAPSPGCWLVFWRPPQQQRLVQPAGLLSPWGHELGKTPRHA